MRIAIIGKSGQLARSLAHVAGPEHQLLFFGKEALDVTDVTSVRKGLAGETFEVLINCSAYTAVDAAEEDETGANALNLEAVMHLLEACRQKGAFLIHVSTDYVFDGSATRPYSEEDACNPQSVYGHTKWAGEQLVLDSGLPSLIVRTSWLYSPFGKNFYKTIRRRLEAGAPLQVVNDQQGVPTSALDLARALLHLAERHSQVRKPKLLHVSNTNPSTWYDFAVAIGQAVAADQPISPVDSSAFKTKAKRPAYSVLSTKKLKGEFEYTMRPWREGLAEVLNLPFEFN
jgi:dTDP-4-dehydrorhamnose reductase